MKPITIAAVLAVTGAAAVPAEAAITVTVEQSGGNVVFESAGGPLNVSGLGSPSASIPSARIHPASGLVVLGQNPEDFTRTDRYSGINPGPAFGTGGFLAADNTTTGSGPRWGFVAPNINTLLWVPTGFSSGDTIAASSLTFAAKTFADLGITPGTYRYDWGSTQAGTYDFVTLQVVPLPAAAWLMLSALAGLLGCRRLRQRRPAAGAPHLHATA